MDIDAKIIEVEFRLETSHHPYGHFCNFRFIDVVPNKDKLNKMIYDIRKNPEVDLIDYNYTETPITEKTNLKYFEITRH
tara:strand:- start:438 stop:674 length:237 start_codon:yes stop_codon:yes gene_type:complete